MKENNVTDPVSPQVQGDVKSQNNQGSLEEAVVQPSGNKSKKISNQKDLTDAPPKVARFEILHPLIILGSYLQGYQNT